jgi:hypothetical protein
MRQIPVPEDLGFWIVCPQTVKQSKEGMFLGWCPRIGRFALSIQSSLIADADTMVVIAFGMSPSACF